MMTGQLVGAEHYSPIAVIEAIEVRQAYYTKWARLHRAAYWFMLSITLGLGLAIALSLLLQASALVVAAISIALNFTLAATRAMGVDEKYKRYRVAELDIEFALQEFQVAVAESLQAGNSRDAALLANLPRLQSDVNKVVKAEFAEFFARMKRLDDVHAESIKTVGG